MDITNQSQLDTYLMSALQKTVDYVVDKILETNKELIDKIVYSNAPKVYERSAYGGFGESWTKDQTKVTGTHEVTGEMYQEWQDMAYGPERFVHGSLYGSDYDYTDVREGLADIIYNGLAGDLFGQGFWTKPRDVWKPLIAQIQNNIDEWTVQGFELQGIECRKATKGNFLFWT